MAIGCVAEHHAAGMQLGQKGLLFMSGVHDVSDQFFMDLSVE